MVQMKDLSHILSIFPCMAEITEEDWNQSGVTIIPMVSNSIFEEKRLLDNVYLILDGTVRMYKLSPSGRQITLYKIHNGECCPLMASTILGSSEFEASACVESAGLILRIPASIFRDWIERYPKFLKFIFRTLVKRIEALACLLDSVYFKSIRSRVAEFLIQLSDQRSRSYTLQITHASISIELGTAREVISRTLKYLENEGFIELSRGKIIIVNREALESYIEL